MSMQSRRDLFQAHRLMTQRAALALLRGEPDVPDQPLRRLNVATFSGVMVAMIVVAGFAIWGLLFHGGSPLSLTPGSLIIDKQTGADYVLCGNKELCATVNGASALLALHGATAGTQDVNQSALTAYPHGPTIGIPGLPQDVPAPSLLVEKPWESCTQTLNGVTGVGTQITTTVAVGTQITNQPLGSDLMLVNSEVNGSDQTFVIWNGKRMSVGPVTQRLFGSDQDTSVPAVWLESIPAGPAFEAPLIPGRVQSTVNGPAGQAEVGQLYTINNAGSTNYYVLTQNGELAQITQLQESLLGVLPKEPAPQQVAPTILADRPLASSPQSPGLPRTMPPASNAAPPDAFCAVWTGHGSTLQIETGSQMPQNGTVTNVPGLANQVVVPPEKGALVLETGSNIGYALVTGGCQYPLQSKAVVSYLGYLPSEAVQVPGSLLNLIPVGPGFYPVDAQQPASAANVQSPRPITCQGS
jgi:type VII secretion protein EccB